MLTTLCQYCHRRVPLGSTCQCQQRAMATSERKKSYRRSHEDSHSFYDSKEWVRLRNQSRHYYMGVDILKWYRTGIMTPVVSGIVHHIIPREEEPSKELDFRNLILLSKTTHDQVHAEYNRSESAKLSAQRELREAQRAWVTFMIEAGIER